MGGRVVAAAVGFCRPITQSAEIGRRRFSAHCDCGPWHVGPYPPEIIYRTRVIL